MNEPQDRRKDSSLNPEDKARLQALKETVSRNEQTLGIVQERQNQVLTTLGKLSGNGEMKHVQEALAEVRGEQKRQGDRITALALQLGRWGGGIAALASIGLLITILKLIFQK